VHHSWNGARIDGRNVLEDSKLWSFPNHTLEASGTGVVIRRNVLLNGQDSLFLKVNPFDDLTLEGNIFVGAVYVTSSNNGVGGTRPAIGWRMTYNLLPTITLDRWAFETLSADCNVYMGSGDVVRVITTNGIAGKSWSTLAALQAGTKLDRQSRTLPASSWLTGRLFTDYTGQSAPTFDFADPLNVCGRRVGPS
jgi:hypothetical protein